MPHVPEGLLHVPARRHPFQVLIAAILLTNGIVILSGGPIPGSVDAIMEPWIVTGWALGIAVGGGLLVIAALLRDELTALLFEYVAAFPLFLLCVAYSVSVYVFAGGRGATIGSLILGLGVACLIRAVQSRTTLRKLRRRSGHG